MKKILKIIGVVIFFLILFIFIFTIAFPLKVELEITNIKNNQEVTDSFIQVLGKYTGSPDKITVNGEVAEKKSSTNEFRKILELKPGDNKITVEAYSRNKPIYKTESVVYFDFEGKLYLEKEKEFSIVPNYELVRKEDIENGFTAIIYGDITQNGQIVDDSLIKIVQDIKGKNANSGNISLLIFSQSDKQSVEETLEKEGNEEGLKLVSSKVKANYEKTSDSNELYLYPSGLDGNKIALETK